MITNEVRKRLEKQQYRIVGSHSAVKICHWTKSVLRGKGGCYKMKFYGINSHQCLQMTTNLSCPNRCIFCWRDYKAPVSKKWIWKYDDPEYIIENCIKAHQQLLAGFKGYEKVNLKALEESKEIKHAALSLVGEPIAYPKINDLIKILNKKEISTFLVTKGQYPEQIKKLAPVTQLYLSLDAPNKEILKKIDLPLFKDYWERLNKSLKYLSKKKQRTCIRLTLVKGINMILPEKYAKLILKAKPDFVEVKSYMHVGSSTQRLSAQNMPLHSEIVEFSKELVKFLPGYQIVDEHVPSRVVLIAKEKFKKKDGWHTHIDFAKYNKLVLSGKSFTTDDYLK